MEFISLRIQNPYFLLGLLVCLITLGVVSCENGVISSMESTKSPEPTTTPIVGINSNAESNEDTRQDALSDNATSKSIKLRCKDAKEKEDRLLCDTLIPLDLREDAVITDSFEITYCEIDLNGDGATELIVWESSWAGTSGGGLWVLGKRRNGYRKIFETEMTWTPIILLPSTHNGWKDFAYQIAGGGVKPFFTTVSNRGKSYKNMESAPEQPDGEILIRKQWSSSTFGPISNQ